MKERNMFGYKIIYHNGEREIQFCRNEMKEWVKDIYNIYNALFFDCILPEPDEGIIFIVTNSKKIKSLGSSYPTRPYKIRINFRYDLSDIEYENILLHEMIHIWQFLMGYSGGHGKTFKRKAKEFNKYGCNVQVSYKNILIDIKDAE